MTFIDTNYFVRFLLNDVSTQHDDVVKLFHQGAAGTVKLCTTTAVILELFWVFSSFYKKSKLEVCTILDSVLSLKFIEIENSSILEQAVILYKKYSVEFEDCYNLAYTRYHAIPDFKTFDKKLLKVVQKVK